MAEKIKIGGELDPRTPEKILGDASTIKDRTWANAHSDVSQTPNQKQDEINEYLQKQIDNIVATEQGGIQTDASPAEGSVKLVQSGGTYTAIKNAETTAKTFSTGETVPNTGITPTPTNDTNKLVTSKGVKDAIENIAFSTNEKIKDIGIDSEPTAGSDNLVKSGGINKKFGIPIDLIEGSAIMYDGTKIQQEGFGVSNPIFLKKDCIVTITARVLNISTISLTNEQGTVFTRVAGASSGETPAMKTYTYTAIGDCYVVVCGKLSTSSNIYYTDTLLFDKDKGIANGIAPLNNNSKVDKNYLPDIEEQDLPSSTQLVTNAYIGRELNYSIIGKYILYNPENPTQNAHLIDGTQNLVTTLPIFLRKNETIQVKCGGKGFAAIALTDSTGSQYTIVAGTKSSDPTPENPVTYSYTAVEDCYVASSVLLTSFDEENSYILGVKDFIQTKEKGTANGIALLDENAKLDEEYLPDGLQDLVDKVKIPIDFSNLGYAIIYDDQTKIQQEGFAISDVIQLTEGNSISINTRGYNIATISLTNAEGTTFTRLAGRPSSTPIPDAQTYTYTAIEDCYVILCGTIASAKNMYYTIDTVVAEILTEKNIEHTVTVELESGTFNQDTGEPLYADLTIKPLINYINRNFLLIENSVISDFQYDSENYKLIYCFYDSNFVKVGRTYVGNTREILQPFNKSKYIRFSLEKIDTTTPDAKANNRPTITFTLSNNSKSIIWESDGCRPLGESISGNVPYRCSQMLQYELSSVPLDYNSDTTVYDTYYGNNSLRAINTGMIMLPKNYRSSGTPTPLVIFFTGTDGWVYNRTVPASSKWTYLLNTLCDMGYAVCGCGTFTNLYTSTAYGHLEGVESDMHELDPAVNLAIKCYEDLYNYVQKYYNVTKEVYVFGKSAGGLLSSWFAYHKNIPIKCCAGLAPSLDIFTNWKILAFSRDINWWAKRLGVSDEELSSISENGIPGSAIWSDEQKAIIETFYTKMIGLNPFFLGLSEINIAALAHELVYTAFTSSSLMGNTTLQGMINHAKKVQPTPIKFWQAEDDVNVPIATAKMWKKMVDNGGGYCALRVMPNNTGAHQAVDDPNLSIHTTISTRYGGEKSIPAAFAEMIDWFEEWK